MAAGRPTKYNQTVLERAQEYAGGAWSDNGDVVPSVVGLALYIGVNKTTLYDWASKNQEFSHTLDNVKAEQERIAMNGAMTNTYNATISKLILANHGYSDKVDTTLQGGEKPVKTENTFVIQPVKAKDD